MKQLIEDGREYPVRYDTTHEEYVRTKLKYEIWSKIDSEMNCTKELEEFRAVSIKKLLYVWDEVSQSFIKLAGLDKGVSTVELHGYNGFDTHQQFLRQVVYGNNEIIAPVESVLKLLLLEIFTPFYIFLIFTLCVWMSENYYYYTVAIIIMTVFGVSSSILQTRTVIQTRTHGSTLVKAVVIRTGYMTAKGSLVRSILYPPPADFKFDQDSYKFIGVLAIIAALGLIYTVIMKSEKGISPSDIAIKALDIITIVIPPALPAAMTVGKLYAQNRLKALNIFCMNSRVINVCGSINCVCFDKTGTLTEDGLDMWGVIPIESNQFKSPLRDVSQLRLGPLLYGMVSCHSNTIIDNKVSGDPLDIKIQWELRVKNKVVATVADHVLIHKKRSISQ
uniref:Cation-transporting ATPase n=1 Tax=Timema douglasi TaxID=61478 RepID=A0A7R8VX00_TIMDO|nr:unnamed protein product [Timema douglasi]